MLTPTALRPALTTMVAVTTAALSLGLSVGLSSPAVADDQVVSPGMPADTGTSVSHVAAPSSYLATAGVTPLQAPIGFGAATTGGAGGRLLHVTTAQDSVSAPAAGSLRWAVRQPGPKWIVFDADLVITLTAPLPLTSDTTVDGRGRDVVITAPGLSGILIHDVTNVVLENLTLRDFGHPSLTHANDPGDAIGIQRASRIWIDHSSLYRAGDKLITAADGVREMTLSWNHFSDQQQTVQIGSMSTANNDVDSTVTVAYNHFDHVGYRTPVVSYGKSHVFNNYIDTWSVSGVRSERLAQAYVENNVFQAGSAMKATIVTPAQPCNDAGTLCDDRPGYLLDTGNLYLGRTKVESTGSTHMFNPSVAYSYTALPATTRLAAEIAAGAGPNATGLVASPAPPTPPAPTRAQPETRIRAKNTKSGKDRLMVATLGARAAGSAATIYRRTSSAGWARVKTVRLDARGRAQIDLEDRTRGAVAKYVVDVAATPTTLESRSNVVAVR